MNTPFTHFSSAAASLLVVTSVVSAGPVLVNDAELAAVRARIESSEPRASAYFRALDFAAPAWRAAEPQAPASFQVPPFYQDSAGHREQKRRLLHDSTAAYGLALRYRLTGDEADARHALRFLLPWVQKVTFVKDAETSLVTSYTFPLMIYAADFLRAAPASVWASDDRAAFDVFLRDTILGYNTAKVANNWGSWGNVLRISIAAYLDDTKLLEESVARHRELVADQLGDKHEFVHEVTRNKGEGTQGISYSHFSLGPLALAARIAQGRGIELFDLVTPNGRSLQPAWHQLAAWTAAPETFPYFKGADLSKMINITTTDFDFYGQARTRLFPIRMGYFELLQSRWPDPAAAEVLADVGPHGLDPTAMQWIGLLFSSPSPKGTPVDVADLKVAPMPSSGNELTWTHSGTGVTGFKIERRVRSGKWTALGTAKAAERHFLDREAPATGPLSYRVRAVSETGASPFWTVASP